jgi:hypothetical protein
MRVADNKLDDVGYMLIVPTKVPAKKQPILRLVAAVYDTTKEPVPNMLFMPLFTM